MLYKEDRIGKLLLKSLTSNQIESLLEVVTSSENISKYADKFQRTDPEMAKTIFKVLKIGSKEKDKNLSVLEKKLEYKEKVIHITNQINSAKNMDEIFLKIQDKILELFDAERITIYAVDEEKNELFSKYMVSDQSEEIRVSINKKSISGYTASSKMFVMIKDAYDIK